MDVIEAIDLLKKYRVYESAERECQCNGYFHPYNMVKCHEIYCKHLRNIVLRLNKQKENAEEIIADIEKIQEAIIVLKQTAQKDFESR